MTRARLRREMPQDELVDWLAFYGARQLRQERGEKKDELMDEMKRRAAAWA